MQVGDYIICKNTFYDWNNIGDSSSIKIKNFLRTPVYKKGQKYKINDIKIFQSFNYSTYSTTCTSSTTTTSTTSYPIGPQGAFFNGPQGAFFNGPQGMIVPQGIYPLGPQGQQGSINYKQYFIGNHSFSIDESDLSRIFYTIKEERSLKLKKILQYEEV